MKAWKFHNVQGHNNINLGTNTAEIYSVKGDNTYFLYKWSSTVQSNVFLNLDRIQLLGVAKKSLLEAEFFRC